MDAVRPLYEYKASMFWTQCIQILTQEMEALYSYNGRTASIAWKLYNRIWMHCVHNMEALYSYNGRTASIT
jgi:hypothetical protein